MKDRATGQDLLLFLEKSCKESGKLFIPDSPRQEAVAQALAEHYERQLLLDSIVHFVKSRSGPFLMFDFAVESKKITDKVKQERESKNLFMQIVKDTHDRMMRE